MGDYEEDYGGLLEILWGEPSSPGEVALEKGNHEKLQKNQKIS